MEVDSPQGAAPAQAGAAAAGARAGAGAAGAGAREGAVYRSAMPGMPPTVGKFEWVKVPAPVVQHERLRLLCSVLRLEACSDSSFQVWGWGSGGGGAGGGG